MSAHKSTLVFATNNAHKLDEVRKIIGDGITVLSLNDIDCHDDIPENESTLEGNAAAKAKWVYNRYGYDCFADDTGLEVDALGGRPGVHSARFAPGTDHDGAANMRHLLDLMDGCNDRSARFRTVIALIEDGELRLFEGKIEGAIGYEPKGTNGFGYDPVFIPQGYIHTFAELPEQVKNSISHRAVASARLTEYLKQPK